MSVKLRVLIIEDSVPDAKLLLRALSVGGYEPEYERVDSREAMAAALDGQSWDIVISDYEMPGFSGLDALRLLQERGLDIPFIMVTGKVGEDVAVEAMRLGASDYILKQNLTRLVPAIQRELRDAEVRRERKRAEEALRESQELLQFIVENSPDNTFVQDTDLRYVWVGRAAEPLTVQEYIGRTDFDLAPTEDARRLTEIKQRVLSEGLSVTVEILLTLKGQHRIFEATYEPRRDSEGRIIGVAGYVRDITETKQAEEALRESEESFRLLFERMSEGFALCEMIWDEKGNPVDFRYLQVNKAWEKQTGLSVEETVGHTVREIIPGIESYWIETYARVVRTGEPIRYENHVADIDRWIEVYAFKHSENRFAALFLDITERKRAEEELRQSEERLRALVTASSDVIYRMSADWSEMFQLSGQRFLANTDKPNPSWLRQYIPPEEQARVLATINEAIRTKSVFQLEHKVIQEDGSIGWTFSRAVPILDANGEILEWFGAASDITERKQVEEALEQERARLRATLESMPDELWITDEKGRIIMVSDSVREHLGRTGWPDIYAVLRELELRYPDGTPTLSLPKNPSGGLGSLRVAGIR